MRFFSRLVTLAHSIRFRLVLWFTLILAVVLTAFSAFIYYNQIRDIRGDAEYHIDRKLAEIEDVLQGSDENRVMLQASDVLVLMDASGAVIASQGMTSSANADALAASARAVWTENVGQFQAGGMTNSAVPWIAQWQGDSKRYIFKMKAVVTPVRSGFIVVGSPFDPYNLSNRLLVTLILGNLLTLFVAITGGFWLADRAMRPVHTITQAARTISETDLNKRLNITGRDELSEMANTFDDMLARLQAAFERQRQFVADASHELRTPLTIVNLETSRALSGKRSPEDTRRALNVIRSENEFMSHLVNDLLTLARMDSGQTVMQKKRLDLGEVTLDVLERLSTLAERKDVHLEAGDLPEVNILGDRQYIMQMLSNLVENAIKYTEGPQKQVRVDVFLDAETATLRVADNGSGIAPADLPHIFERFYRADKARSRDEGEETGGSGLGLAIVDWVAREHGGEVRVHSDPGSGTVFEVRFPAVE